VAAFFHKNTNDREGIAAAAAGIYIFPPGPPEGFEGVTFGRTLSYNSGRAVWEVLVCLCLM